MIAPVSFPQASTLPGLAMTPSVGSGGPVATTHGESGSFSSVLQSFANSTIETLKQGEAAAVGGITGAVPVQSMVEHVLAAERTLQAAVAVRDKLVTAYLEISRMQI